MKFKILFGLMLAALLAFVPSSSQSKDKTPGTVVLSADNLVVLNAQVDGESTAQVITKVKELDAKSSSTFSKRLNKEANKPLYLFLNTPGGSIQSGLEMIEAIKGTGHKVNTITLFAASMGFQIAQNLDDRLIIKNGVLMSHRAKGGFEGEFGGQSPSQIDSRYALWKSRLDELDTQTANRTGGKQTLESYQKQYASEMWLTGQQSVDQGYADEVVTVKCDASLAGTSQHEVLFMGAIPVKYELDNCPLNTSPMNIQVGFVTNKGVMASSDFVAKGGEFGPHCLVDSAANKDKLCSLDTSMSLQKIAELKDTFYQSYLSKMRQVVDRY